MKLLVSAVPRRAALVLPLIFATISSAQTISAVLNGASYSSPLAPGTWAAIFGTGLAPGPAAGQIAPLPPLLNGVSVTIGNLPAPLQYVSPTQINAQIPFEVATLTAGNTVTVPVVVSNASGKSAPYQITLQRNAPAIFSKDGSGTGQALAFDASFQLVTSVGTDPIIFYATGLGPTNPPASTASLGAGAEPFNRIVDSVSVKIGGNDATVLYAGLAPGLDGIYQLNVQPNPYSGNSLTLTMGGSNTSRALTLPIPLGTNVQNASGTVDVLYPPSSGQTTLSFSALLLAGTFSGTFDLAPGAKPFNATANCSGTTPALSAGSVFPSATIAINPAAGTWTATYTAPAVRLWNFPQTGFTVLDFLTGSPFPNNVLPLSRIDPNAAKALGQLPNPTVVASGANGTYQASGALPTGGHVTLSDLAPAAFGSFVNVAHTPGTYKITCTLTIDAVAVATKSATFTE